MLPPVNNGPSGVHSLSQLTRTDLQNSVQRVTHKTQQRHSGQRNLFQGLALNPNQSVYKNIVQMVGQFISQVMGNNESIEAKEHEEHRNTDYDALDEDGLLGGTKRRKVRGIADRLPWQGQREHNDALPGRDTVFLGDSTDYPGPVIALAYGDVIKPVAYEGEQLVARYLHLNIEQKSIEGQLILANGKRIPIDIHVFTAL